VVIAAALLGGLAVKGEADGPWRGRVVDAETGQPIAGVVVVAVWEKVSPGIIHPRREFHDVDELVTDAEGRFVVPTRSRKTLNPFVGYDGPKLTMFKGGYGRWRFPAGDPNRDDSRPAYWKRMESGVEVFELPPAKTRQERVNAMPDRPYGLDDYSRIPRFMEELNRERTFLGLGPLGTSRGQP
jgi:hypothetical protein